jgi:hypothetical protein
MQLLKNFFRKNLEIPGKVYIIEMNQAGNQIRIGWTHIAVHPSSYEILQIIPMQKTVDSDHDFLAPCKPLPYAEKRLLGPGLSILSAFT